MSDGTSGRYVGSACTLRRSIAFHGGGEGRCRRLQPCQRHPALSVPGLQQAPIGGIAPQHVKPGARLQPAERSEFIARPVVKRQAAVGVNLTRMGRRGGRHGKPSDQRYKCNDRAAVTQYAWFMHGGEHKPEPATDVKTGVTTMLSAGAAALVRRDSWG